MKMDLSFIYKVIFLLLYPCEDNLVNIDWHKPLTRIKQVKASKFHFCIKRLRVVMWSHGRPSVAYSKKHTFFLYNIPHIFVFIFLKVSAKIFSNDCTKIKGSLKKSPAEGLSFLIAAVSYILHSETSALSSRWLSLANEQKRTFPVPF